MREAPGEIDKRACEILRRAVESPDERLEIEQSQRDLLVRYHKQLNGLCKIADYPTEELIAGVMDRYSLWVPKAVAKSLDMHISRKDLNSTSRAWYSIMERLDADLAEIYLRPLHDITGEIFNRYHKLGKPQPVEVIEKFNLDEVMKYFHKLGNEFDKLFNAQGLFPNIEEFSKMELNKETQLFSDERLTIIERIKRFELYRDALNGDILDLQSDTIFDIAEAYWQRSNGKSDRESCMRLIQLVIDRGRDQKIGNDVALGYGILGEKQSAIGKFSEAEKSFKEALKSQRKFGNDNTVAAMLNKLATCIIDNQDPELSKADDWLSEAEKIWLKLGYKKSMLITTSIQVRHLVAQKKYQDALTKIEEGIDLFDEKFYPRGRWMFLSECAEHLLDCADLDMNSRGHELLDEAIDIAKEHGEFSCIIEALSTKQEYAKDDFTLKEAQVGQEHYIDLKGHLDEIIDDFYNKQDNDNRLLEFVIKLKHHNYREGLRRASNFIPIDRVEEIEAEYYDSFEGRYGRYKSLQQELEHLLPVRRTEKISKKQFDNALELLEDYENISNEFDSLYSRTLAMQFRFFAISKIKHFSKFGKTPKRIVKEQKDIISNLIKYWGTMDSMIGVMRWKRRLAVWLKENSSDTGLNPDAISLIQEIAEFYRGRDARRYAYARFDLINWQQTDETVDSAEEYNALLKDPDLPKDSKILIELLRRTAVNLKKESKLDEAIIIMGNANNLAMEKLAITDPGEKDVWAFGTEIDWYIMKGDANLASKKIIKFNEIFGDKWGHIAAIFTKFWNGRIRYEDRDLANSKILFRKGIEKVEKYDFNGARFNRVSLPNKVSTAFHFLIQINTELGQLDKANQVTIEKLYFDYKNGFTGAAVNTLENHVDTIIDISGTESAKEFLIQIIDDVKISPSMVSWAICKLHIKLEEWDDAEIVLKDHLERLCNAGQYGRLNRTIDKLADCCEKNKDREHAILTLQELVSHDIHEIVSSALHTLIRMQHEEENFEKLEHLYEYKIKLELEKNRYHIAGRGYESLADVYLELEEHEKAINILIEYFSFSTAFAMAQSAIAKIVQIYRDKEEINEAKETLQNIIESAEQSENQYTSVVCLALFNLQVEMEDFVGQKDILRKLISLEKTSQRVKQDRLEKLFKLHYQLKEDDYAKKVLQEKLSELKRTGKNRHFEVTISTEIINLALLIEEYSIAEEAMVLRSKHDYPESLQRRAEEIDLVTEELKLLSHDDLEMKTYESFLRTSKQMKKRDKLNGKVKSLIQERNEINGEVKNLINEVKQHVSERNELNNEARNLKKITEKKAANLKQAKQKSKSILNQLNQSQEQSIKLRDRYKNAQQEEIDADKEQESAYKDQISIVNKAQNFQNLIEPKSKQIDLLKQKATSAHNKLQNVKQEADSSHERFIENMLYFEAAVRAKMENNLTN